ncbi:hypothetical protein AU255_05785 [Methyloprofundus sedimenti]|uniref:4Fe-4S ferredoxin-type domain-containing protein n=1 Tax=Methyloprofundus sedimenti TaxID=1420851 RepID=A0A1V8M736_9GAMM|nr:hypothetical protein [Methyloprofundus sedimenti]OQK17390.1 hypothetical protein AU255_05785 [Methyloprofundus sedimenti]
MRNLLYLFALFTLSLNIPLAADNIIKNASDIRFTGRLTSGLACTQDCSNCCTGNMVEDYSKTLNINIGSSAIDLSEIYNDGLDHAINGYFYQITDSCEVGNCSLFHITSIDQPDLPLYNSQADYLTIPSVLVDDNKLYQVDLSGPFIITSAVEIAGVGEDCSKEQQCAEGYSCISYFGIAGNELKSCEISCENTHCPIGQSCISIADGPQNICQ